MKKVMMLCTALLAISFLFTVVPLNVESQDPGPTTIVKGTVYDAVTEEPLDMAVVRLFTDTNSMGQRTGEDGTYEFELTVLRSEALEIVASKEGYYDQWKDDEIARDETLIIDFYLEPKASKVFGYVTDIDTEEPMPRVYVELRSTDFDGEGMYAWTNEEGYYELFAEPGNYKLISGFEGYEVYQSDEFYLGDGEELEWNITLEPVRTGVFGVVMNEGGGGIPEAYIRVYDEQWTFFAHTFSDEEGNYEIRAPPGEYIIEVSADDYFDYDDVITVPEDGMLEYDVEMTEITVTGVLQYIVDYIMEIIGGIF
jgi:hypothetical protein